MSMSSMTDHWETVLNTCDNHKISQGNGRECEWYADSEFYAQDTVKTNVTTTNGSH